MSVATKNGHISYGLNGAGEEKAYREIQRRLVVSEIRPRALFASLGIFSNSPKKSYREATGNVSERKIRDSDHPNGVDRDTEVGIVYMSIFTFSCVYIVTFCTNTSKPVFEIHMPPKKNNLHYKIFQRRFHFRKAETAS